MKRRIISTVYFLFVVFLLSAQNIKIDLDKSFYELGIKYQDINFEQNRIENNSNMNNIISIQ